MELRLFTKYNKMWLLLGVITNWFLFSNGDVETTSGPVRGTKIEFMGNTVDQYLGIPFAQPPLSDLRFKKPQPVESWTETYVADTMPPACIQFIELPYPWYDSEVKKDEDCLYLNLWAPQSSETKIPVMVWIFGGAFSFGSISLPVYNGQALATVGEAVVVTVNYRLNEFGFLTSYTEDAPGNVGMYDLVMALNWVKENIEKFGGDPDRVTLFGQDAGAVAIGLLCVSPLAEGLFQRVIMLGASPAYLLAENNTVNIEKSQHLAEAVGCADDSSTIYDDPEGVVGCLRGKDAMDLVKTSESFNPVSVRSFFPNYGDDILPQNAREALIEGNFHDVDVLIGSNKDEGAFHLTTNDLENFGFFGEKDPQINMSYGEDLLRKIFRDFSDPDAVVEYYLGDVDPENYAQIRYQIYTAHGDYVFVCPTIYFAEAYGREGKTVYFYFFEQRPSNTPWAEWMGVMHFEEVQFAFGVPLQHPENYMAEEQQISDIIIKALVLFAKNGSVPFDNFPSYSRDQPQYIRVYIGPTDLGQGPHKDNCDFFRKYFGFD